MPPVGRGRPRIWCSQGCRRAAYEERRAASRGAIAIRVVRVMDPAPPPPAHSLNDCMAAVALSPTACRRVLDALTVTAARGELRSDPRWDATFQALVRLVDALNSAHRRR
jgi:hypothetical protein